MLPRISRREVGIGEGGSPEAVAVVASAPNVYVGRVTQHPDTADIEASGLLDGLTGEARAERAELIPYLLDLGITVEEIKASFAPMLLSARRVLGDDGTYLSARRSASEPVSTSTS